ncbi:hypothetical protein F511_17032 [Dorcoceras hygrometricum]|uniref:Uncharacterized protein n=1 Tax=Dorcoceras hygrometricum TaxID=472368 RepID=A0A2Z7CDU1_9LAMI|nr:hypothetical protein F511_17032 [Dorcoceras hygrometricum]
MLRRYWSTIHAASCAWLLHAGRQTSSGVAPLLRDDAHGRARHLCRARFFVGGAAVGRPPLRRSSGDIVTAGLNSSRVWFGPVPGSP